MSLPIDVQIAKRAREMIADPNNWCQGIGARTADGMIVDWEDASAVRFCAYGSLNRAALDLGLNGYAALSAVWRVAFAMTDTEDLLELFLANDAPDGHAAVLAMFDGYIAGAQS